MVKPTRLTPSVELVPDVVQMAMVWTSRPTWKQFWQVWSPNLQFLGSDSALQTIQPMGQWVGWRGSHCLFPSNTNLFCWPPLHVWELLGKEPHVPSHYSRVAWKYWVYVGGKSSYNPCIYVCIYIYMVVDQNSFIPGRPFFANKHFTFAKLSQTPPCWPTTPLMKIRSPPAKLRQRITDHFLVAF